MNEEVMKERAREMVKAMDNCIDGCAGYEALQILASASLAVIDSICEDNEQPQSEGVEAYFNLIKYLTNAK